MLNVFITNLSAYNAGRLIGEWFTLPADEDALNAKMEEIIAKGGGEELFLTDWEWDGGVSYFEVGEYSNIIDLNDKAWEVEEIDEYDKPKLGFLTDVLGYNMEEALQAVEDTDYYPDMDLKDLAYHFVEEGLFGEGEQLGYYFDVQSYVRDLEIDGWYADDRGVWSPDQDSDDPNEEPYYPEYRLVQMVEEWADDAGIIPLDAKTQYLDYDAIARDLGMDYHEYKGGVFRHD